MTAHTFVEAEHPRTAAGEFTAKANDAPTGDLTAPGHLVVSDVVRAADLLAQWEQETDDGHEYVDTEDEIIEEFTDLIDRAGQPFRAEIREAASALDIYEKQTRADETDRSASAAEARRAFSNLVDYLMRTVRDN